MVSALTQSTRPAAVATVLGEDVLSFKQMHVRQHLGQLFEMRVIAVSERDDIVGKELLGTNASIRTNSRRNEPRYFNGFICEFSSLGVTDRLAHYELVLRPWLWFLTRTSDCRIYQDMTVPEIIKQVFNDNGFSSVKDKLTGSYRTWPYCVQYRETVFNFVSRLMEQEGIYYYFDHENGSHDLVLADDFNSHDEIKDYETVPYFPPGNESQRETDHVWDWVGVERIQSGEVTLNSYDFERPATELLATSKNQRDHENASLAIYDYDGEYTLAGDGQQYATVRMQELQSSYETLRGEGNVGGLFAGGIFTLTAHALDAMNTKYLILSSDETIVSNEYENTPTVGAFSHVCRLQAIRTEGGIPYRSPRITPKPEIAGPQTAVVTGSAGEEIYTDKYGRIKVKFRWDRHNKADENSSCWIRVSRNSAGKGWGGMFTPRVGHEVIVEFLEGDPDRPIVTGSLWNTDNMPPYSLPQNATISTVKTNSSKGGDGFNEIRFEDKKGDEQLLVHAEKNQDITVKEDRFETVHNDRHLTVGNDKFEEVKSHRHETVAENHHETIGGNRHINVDGHHAAEVGETLSLKIGGDVGLEFGADHSQKVTGDSYYKAKNIVIEADTNITIKVGQSFIAISEAGIKISTPTDVVVDAKKNVSQKAGLKMDLESTMGTVKANGVQKVTASGMVQVQGGLVKIN